MAQAEVLPLGNGEECGLTAVESPKTVSAGFTCEGATDERSQSVS